MQKHATFHDLEGQHVFITGGGSGIGALLTSGFLGQGAKVSFVQRSNADAFVAEMEQLHGQAPLFIKCDLTDVEATHKAMSKAVDTFGDIQILINNAANDTRHTIAETTVQEWDENHAVNLRPYFFTSQFVASQMAAKGKGVIINYSSVSYQMGNGGFSAYITANAGILGLTRGLARELGPDGVRVNAVIPGWIMTQRQLDLWVTDEKIDAFLKRQCLQTPLEPEDMVGPTLFLASDISKMITSQAIAVDGGISMTG